MTLAINYIEIENFKSYFGKNILGPFHPSFNAVIGPNGSGKSNVIDSLLFVFGFRAQKIRTKKISVLIHNSDQHPNVNSCSVTIFFRKIKENGPNNFEIIPNSEFTVKRTAYKDNSSEYFIDNKKVQFKEVGTLLRECGVDLDHNRFLILQGEVESISLLKPKASNEHEEGLLEYLEDLIGTIRFKPMLESISVEIDKINEIRTEKANRVQNLQKDKNSLETPKNEAINYLKKENELIETKSFYYQVKIFELEKLIENRKEECEKLKTDMEALSKKLEELNDESQTTVAQCNVKKKEFDKQSKLSEKLKRQFEEYEKEDVQLRENIKHTKEQIKKLRKNIETEREKIKTFTELPEKNEAKIEELQEKLEEFKTELDEANKDLKNRLEQVNDETIKLQEKKKPIEAKLNKLQSSVNEAKSKMDIAQSELEVLLNNQNYEKDKLEQTKSKMNELIKTVEDKKNQINELEKNGISKLENEFKMANTELNDIYSKEKAISETLGRSRQTYAEAQSNFSSNKNRGRVLSFLMQQKSEGKLKGIYGRLGDLGAIDEKYDVAISTACGSLDCIVVDTIDTAQACVECLKKSNVGSATFIALEKQEKWREHLNRKISTPENVPRLVDLIKVNDEKLLNAFYYSLRNTLVANNLEQATRIAFDKNQRNRVVTLKGEILEVSGTMSGGGQPMRGRMGTKITSDGVTVEQIKMMQEKLGESERELRELLKRKNELEPVVDDLGRKLENAKETLIRLRYEVKSATEQLSSLRKNEENILKKISEIVPDEAAQKRLEDNLAQRRADYEKAESLALNVREENESICKKIVEISKRILDGPKEKLKSLEKQVEEANAQILSAQVEIKTAKRNLVQSEKKLASMEEELEQSETNLESYGKRLESIDEESKELVEKHELVKIDCQNLEKEIADFTKILKQSDVKKQKFETEKIDLNHKIEKIAEGLKSNNHENSHYKSLLDALKLHDIEHALNSQENEEDASGVQLKKFDEDILSDADMDSLKKAIHELEHELKNQSPNLNAIQSYRELEAKFMDRVSELEQITQQRDQLCNNYEDLRKQRLEEFMSGFTLIRLKLKEIYRTVTLDGDAELELVDSLDPFTEGIVLSVRPPKKSWKNVSNLSGGEKTLSSLSLVFALHEFRSTPIYVMDEIDAALDFKNVSIIAHYLKERTKNAQFIIISLRNNMFELCDRLFGIYKVRNCTSAAFISPNLIEFDEKKKVTKNNNLTNGNNNQLVAAVMETGETQPENQVEKNSKILNSSMVSPARREVLYQTQTKNIQLESS